MVRRAMERRHGQAKQTLEKAQCDVVCAQSNLKLLIQESRQWPGKCSTSHVKLDDICGVIGQASSNTFGIHRLVHNTGLSRIETPTLGVTVEIIPHTARTGFI